MGLAGQTMLAHDLLSSLAYSMITHIPLVASNLPTNTLVARQQPTHTYTHTHTYTYTHTHIHTHTHTHTHVIVARP